jgi:hypothetical protein
MANEKLVKQWLTLLKQYSKEKTEEVLTKGVEVEKQLGCTGDVGQYSYFTRTKFFRESIKNQKKGIDI